MYLLCSCWASRHQAHIILISIFVFLFLLPGTLNGFLLFDLSRGFFGVIRLVEYSVIAYCIFLLHAANKAQSMLFNILLINVIVGFFQYIAVLPNIDPAVVYFFLPSFQVLLETLLS